MTTYAFVDGAALLTFIREASETLAPGQDVPVSYEKAFDSLAMLAMPMAERMFFYHAYPSQRQNEADDEFARRWDETEALFKQLNRLPGVHVRTGVTTRHRKKGNVIQKGVDVLLAIDAYGHATSGNIEQAILVLSDLDFLPLLEAFRQTRVRTTLAYVPRKTNDLLIEAADFARPIRLKNFLGWCIDSSLKEKFEIAPAGEGSTDNWQNKKRATLIGREGDLTFGTLVTGGLEIFAVKAPHLLKQQVLVCKSWDLLVEEIEARGGAQLKFGGVSGA